MVSSERPERPWQHPIYDFKIYDSPQPLKELRRLIDTKHAHDQADAAHNLLHEQDLDDQKTALSVAEFNEAVSKIPNSDSRLQHQCLYALSLLSKGRQDIGLPLLRTVFMADSRWREVARRIIEARSDAAATELLATVVAL